MTQNTISWFSEPIFTTRNREDGYVYVQWNCPNCLDRIPKQIAEKRTDLTIVPDGTEFDLREQFNPIAGFACPFAQRVADWQARQADKKYHSTMKKVDRRIRELKKQLAQERLRAYKENNQ